MVDPLPEADSRIIVLAARTDLSAGEKANEIRELGGDALFYARLRRLLDTEAALAAFPADVLRLRRLYLDRAEHRLGGRRGLPR